MQLTARAYVRDSDDPFWLYDIKWISLETGAIMGPTGLQYTDYDLYLTINGDEVKVDKC